MGVYHPSEKRVLAEKGGPEGLPIPTVELLTGDDPAPTTMIRFMRDGCLHGTTPTGPVAGSRPLPGSLVVNPDAACPPPPQLASRPCTGVSQIKEDLYAAQNGLLVDREAAVFEQPEQRAVVPVNHGLESPYARRRTQGRQMFQ